MRPMDGEFLERPKVRTRIGLDHYTIAHRGFTARQTLEFAQAHHFDGVQFEEPAVIDPRLDHARLAEYRRAGRGDGALSRGRAAVAEPGPPVP